MTAEPLTLHTPEAVRHLPDGSVISWLRIEGDETSRAVAFTRREGDEFWISPGGGTPHDLEVITNYPVDVYRLGEVDGTPEEYAALAAALGWPDIDYSEQIAADTRRACLDLAVRWTAPLAAAQGKAFTGTLFDVADAFGEYIRTGAHL